MTTAVVGASMVALVTGTLIPDLPDPNTNLALVDANAAHDAAERTKAVNDRASRSDPRGVGATAALPAPDLFILPLRSYTLTSKFGARWGRQHKGIDLAAPGGTAYHSIARGKVILARAYGGYGNCIMIEHGGGIVSVYGHSSRIRVKEGQMVEAGDWIGDVGNTGYSFGNHLHLEIRVNEVQTDPIKWLLGKGADVPGKSDALTQ